LFSLLFCFAIISARLCFRKASNCRCRCLTAHPIRLPPPAAAVRTLSRYMATHCDPTVPGGRAFCFERASVRPAHTARRAHTPLKCDSAGQSFLCIARKTPQGKSAVDAVAHTLVTVRGPVASGSSLAQICSHLPPPIHRRVPILLLLGLFCLCFRYHVSRRVSAIAAGRAIGFFDARSTSAPAHPSAPDDNLGRRVPQHGVAASPSCRAALPRKRRLLTGLS